MLSDQVKKFVEEDAPHYLYFLEQFLTDDERSNLWAAWNEQKETREHYPNVLLKRNHVTPYIILGWIPLWHLTEQGVEYWQKISDRLMAVPVKGGPPTRKGKRTEPSDKPKTEEKRTMKKIVLVTFINSSSGNYSYFTDLDVKKGDIVVVETKFGLKTAEVTKTEAISKAARDMATKWVVQKVDIEAHEARRRRQDLIAEIENELDAAMQQEARYAMFAKMAESSPKIKELLDRLAQVDPNLVPQIGS